MTAPAWRWEDAYEPREVRSLEAARAAVRLEVNASRHFPAEVWAPGARRVASQLDASGFTILADVLRRHIGRVLASRATYGGRRVG